METQVETAMTAEALLECLVVAATELVSAARAARDEGESAFDRLRCASRAVSSSYGAVEEVIGYDPDAGLPAAERERREAERERRAAERVRRFAEALDIEKSVTSRAALRRAVLG